MAIDLGLDKANGILDSKYGLVCAMDVLGVRQKSKNDPHKMITNLLNLNKNFLLEKLGQDHKKNRDRDLLFEESYKYYTTDASVDIFILGDTYFIAKRFQENPLKPIELWSGIRSILTFFRMAMKNGFMMRGAVSIDKYYWSYGESFVVGPAISDAIEWCEKANWIGLHFTPDAGAIAKEAIANIDVFYRDLFFEYDVPLRVKFDEVEIKKPKKMLCIGWPSFFCPINLENPSKAFDEGENKLSRFSPKKNRLNIPWKNTKTHGNLFMLIVSGSLTYGILNIKEILTVRCKWSFQENRANCRPISLKIVSHCIALG